jgi:hypothetical protein
MVRRSKVPMLVFGVRGQRRAANCSVATSNRRLVAEYIEGQRPPKRLESRMLPLTREVAPAKHRAKLPTPTHARATFRMAPKPALK